MCFVIFVLIIIYIIFSFNFKYRFIFQIKYMYIYINVYTLTSDKQSWHILFILIFVLLIKFNLKQVFTLLLTSSSFEIIFF